MRLVADLAVTDVGDGPLVLFLHGIGSSRSAFECQVDALRGRFRCVCPDAPGYADSADRPMDSIDSYASMYESLIAEIAPVGPIGVVGVSFGGVVAARLVHRNLVKVGALVLADTSFGSGVDPASASAMRSRSGELDRLGSEAFAAARGSRLLSPSADTALIERVQRVMASSIRQPGYGDATAAMAVADLRDIYPEIDCPTLVLVGAHDAVCPPCTAQNIATVIPDAEYAEIAGAGHLANQEQPDRFNALVGDFLVGHLTTPHETEQTHE